MKPPNWRVFFMAMLISLAALSTMGGCDSGEKAVNEVTGSRAVRQYQESKKNLEKISDGQAEKYRDIVDDEGK